MSKKFKIITIFSTLCFAIAILTFGVLSLKNVSLNVGGDISLNADGVKATISKGSVTNATYTSGSSSTKMLAVTIDGNNNLTTVENNLATWENLGFTFNSNKDDVYITFSVTNNHSNNCLKLNMSTNVNESVNTYISCNYLGDYVLFPGESVNYKITLCVKNKNAIGLLQNFHIGLFMSNYNLPLESDYQDTFSFTYESGSQEASISGLNPGAASIDIPFAFKGNDNNLYKVTTISNSAFASYSNLTYLEIPNSVTLIDYFAFKDCSSLSKIIFGGNVKTIRQPFTNCSSLSSVHIGDLENWCNISFADFNSNPLKLAKNLYINGCLADVLYIPSSITKINNYVFQNLESLKNIYLHNNVTLIGNYSFYYCTNLQEINIPNNVSSLGSYAFHNCTSLKSLTIGESVAVINTKCFQNCSSLTELSIPNSVINIGDSAFSGCSRIVEIYIGDGIIGIVTNAFQNCSNIKRVYINNLEAWLKINFGSYTANPIHNGATLYLMGAYSGVLTIPSSITQIKSYAFYGSRIVRLNIPSTVQTIGSNAFKNCVNLTQVYIDSPDIASLSSHASSGILDHATRVYVAKTITNVGAGINNYFTKGSTSGAYVVYNAK